MKIKEYPNSLPQYSEEQQRALIRQGILALAGFIAVKVLLTYVIHRATHNE
jgi:hypothetical protein